VSLLVLTDHDTVSGFAEAAAAGSAELEVRAGVELNTSLGDSVHILGYGLRWRDAAFLERLSDFRERRFKRVRLIVDNLRARGIELSYEEVRGESRETLGRPHVADALVRKGVVSSRQEAFNRFLANGKPAYVGPMGPSPAEALALIRDCGGFSSLAHPQTVKDLSLVKEWVKLGLEGLEVHYAGHSPSERKRYADIAGSLGLLATGGSDYHGPGSGRDMALGVDMPDQDYVRFRERLSRCD
jgi:predicted metal-dependent phosphoesterase TrpH